MSLIFKLTLLIASREETAEQSVIIRLKWHGLL